MTESSNGKLEVRFSAEDYMSFANPNIQCIKCGIPMVEWLEEGRRPTGEYFCGMCGICIHQDGTQHQLPKNHQERSAI